MADNADYSKPGSWPVQIPPGDHAPHVRVRGSIPSPLVCGKTYYVHFWTSSGLPFEYTEANVARLFRYLRGLAVARLHEVRCPAGCGPLHYWVDFYTWQ